MIDLLLPYIRRGHVRALPEYTLFLNSQKTIIDERYRRIFSSFGHETRGTMVLKYILQFNDWDYYYNNCINNYARYSKLLRYTRKDLIHIFDRTLRGRGYRNLFFNGSTTEEFLLPIEDWNATVNLPLDTDDWNIWKYVRPFRIIDHNSNELTTNLLNSYVTFKEPPTYCIELLDVIGLIFKYGVWNQHIRPNDPDPLAKDAPMQYFIHKYVICDTIYDLADIFFLRQFNRLIHTPKEELSSFYYNSLQKDNQYGRISQHANRAYEALHKTVCQTGQNTPPEALLNSNILLSGSITDRIYYIDKYLPLPITRPYEYVTWMRDQQLFFSVVTAYKRQRHLPTTKTILVNMDRDYQRMLKRRIWNSCNDNALKKDIEETMLKQAAYLKDETTAYAVQGPIQ